MTARAKRRHPVAGAYARALLAVGEERKESDAYGAELIALARDVLAAGPLRAFFESPRVPRGERKIVFERALGGKISRITLNLLLMLIDRGRQELLGQIADAYEELLDALRGRVHVRVTSAIALPAGVQAELEELLRKRLDKEILTEATVEPALLGGMTVQVGDRVVDGTVRTRLNILRDGVAAKRLGKELIHEN